MAQNKHLSYNDIPDYQTDWMKDPTNDNKPFSGQSTQKFIKQELQKSYGYSRTASGYMQFFRSPEDADAYDQGDTSRLLSQVSLQGTNVEFRFLNQYAGNVYINGNNAYLFPLNVRSVDVNSDGSETPHDTNISLAIQVNLNNGTTTTDLGQHPANAPFEVNITPYVADGATFVFVASDEDGNRRTSNRYSVVRANLSVATQNNTWWANAYRRGDTQWNVPLALDVNVPSELRVTVSRDNVNYVTKTVPSTEFSANYALTFDHPMQNDGTEGAYHLHLELVATDEHLASLAPATLDADIFCVAQTSNALLLVVNNLAQEIQNYTNNRVLDYAVFAGSGNHTLTITAKEDTTDLIAPQTITAQNGTVGTFYLPLEMERIDDTDFTVAVAATLDDSATSAFSADVTATNRLGYAATAGAKVLVKATGRSNTEQNREQLINLLNGSAINPTWQNMTWSSVDGYQTRTIKDSAGQDTETAFIRLLSGESLQLPLQPLKMTANQGRTLEILFQPRNIMNYDTPVIQCLDADNEGSGFSGLRVTPSRITLLTNGSRNEDTQSKNFDPEDIQHLTIVVNPAYNEAGTAFPACFIYLNGVKQRVFRYEKDLNVSAKLIFGSADADLDIYAVRTYNTALKVAEVETNAVNWQFSLNDKAAMKAKVNIREAGKVEFNKVRSLCNVFVIRSNDGEGRIPAWGMGKKDTIPSTLRTYWRDHPEWNSTIESNVQGQGTSSQEYMRWNFKGSQSQAWNFDGGTHTPIKKWCAKKNFASSMQSHKMGGVEEYDYLARATGAVEQDAARQAIWQYPFVGFAEDKDGNLTFIGLYTIGPDKGDKDTFGFGSSTVAMEGLDNDRLSTNFRCPWNDSTVAVDDEGEEYTVCGEKAWEDSRKNTAGVTARWKPAYNLVYECSQLIRPWKGATVGGTTYPATAAGLQQYAAAIAAIDTTTDAGKQQYQEATMYDYWISSSYDLYRYDPQQHEYVQAYTDHALNLSTDLCGKNYVVGQQQSGGQTTDILLTTTLLADAADDDARNTLFLKARLSKFKKEIGQHFDVRNAFFHLAWVEFKAATDNLAKNTYPYLMDYTDPSARWRWRQDDVDTVGPIENQGKDKKPYCVELEDNYSDYGMAALWVWNGRFSQFWYTLREAFATEYEAFVRDTFFPALHYGTAQNLLQRCLDFFRHFEFDRAQEYFGPALYNADGIWTYEQSYLTTADYAHKGIALEQLLGDHYSAEKYWIRMRIIYMMSKYRADLFAAGATADCFATRVGSGTNSYTITPAIYMYPVVQNGEQALQGPRFWPGNSQLTEWTAGPITTAGDQTFRINGMSYLRSVGNLYQNTLKESVSVAGQMLRQLNLGSRTADAADIHSTITALTIDNATSLRTLDLAQLPTLAGSVNLSACANLRELYATGTALSAVQLSDGGPLQTLVLGDNIATLALLGKQQLTTLTIGNTSRLANVEMQNCNAYTVSRVLSILAAVPASQLQSVRLGFSQSVASPSIINDTDIQTLIALGGSPAETKQFSGYVTKASGSISGSAWAALDAMNISYVGEVVGEVAITALDGSPIEDNAATLYSGDSARLTARVVPPTDKVLRFRLYNGSTLVAEDAQGRATYNGLTLDCATGQLTSASVSAAFTVGITAAVDDVESQRLALTVERTVTMGGISLGGAKAYKTAQDNNIAITPTNSDYTVRATQVVATLTYGGADASQDEYLRLADIDTASLSLKARVLAIPTASREYVLSVTVTDVKGNEYSAQTTVTVQSIPVSGFAISGPDNIYTAGTYDYTISDLTPADYNRGIDTLTVAAGSLPVTVNGTGGFSLSVAEVTAEGVSVEIVATATIQGGGNVTVRKTVTIKERTIVQGFVDLGLPSGLLWADRNVGADAPEGFGLYFSWGNTEGHEEGSGYDFSDANYNASPGKQISGDIALSQDAANAYWGGDCRMPTRLEFQELYDNCDSAWVTENGVAGRRFTSKTNGNSIFFPAAGNYNGTSLRSRGSYGYYWSASRFSGSNGYYLYFNSGGVTPQDYIDRRYGFSVRAVQ